RFFTEVAGLGTTADTRVTLDRAVWSGSLLAAYHKLDAALEALGGYVEARQTSEALEQCTRRAKQLRDDLATIVDGGRNQVTWAEVRSRSAAIGASPIELGSMLKARLFAQIPAIVLTSATLTTDQGFSFLRSRLGLEDDELPVGEIEVASPFDFPSRA